jgi:hypothetical protein
VRTSCIMHTRPPVITGDRNNYTLLLDKRLWHLSNLSSEIAFVRWALQISQLPRSVFSLTRSGSHAEKGTNRDLKLPHNYFPKNIYCRSRCRLCVRESMRCESCKAIFPSPSGEIMMPPRPPPMLKHGAHNSNRKINNVKS